MRVWRITSGLLVAASFAASTAAAQPPGGTARPDAGGPVLVLPFVNLTGDPAEDWIGAGIAEALAAGFPAGTAVVAQRGLPSAADAPADAPVAVDEAVGAGRADDAPFVLVGAYQRFGSRLRITARVVSVAAGEVVRSAIADGAAHDLFDLQDRVLRALSGSETAAGAAPTLRQEPAAGDFAPPADADPAPGANASSTGTVPPAGAVSAGGTGASSHPPDAVWTDHCTRSAPDRARPKASAARAASGSAAS